MKITNYNIMKMMWIPIVVFFIMLNPITSFAQEDVNPVTVEIKTQTGDRLDLYQTVLKIYQDGDVTPYQTIEFPKTNPFTIESLPENHVYKIEVFVTGMFAETIKITDETMVEIVIPGQGGMKFSITYDDGQTPLEGAKLVLKSNDGQTWQQDVLDSKGESKRFWMQSNNLADDYYVVEITIDQSITYTSTEKIKFYPNLQDTIEIKTPWPIIVDDLITVSVYKNLINKVNLSDGKFIVELYDKENNKISESKVTHKGKASFSNLKVGQYSFSVVEDVNDLEPSPIIFPTTNSIITGKETTVSIFGKIPSPAAENTCNCVAFRLDDVQDYFLNTQQIEIMNVFKEKEVPLTLGIIGGFWGEDPKVLEYIQEDVDSENPIFEIGNHSWDNNPLPTFSKNDQITQLQKTNDIIQETLGVTPTTFTPVENKFNEDTINALKELGFTHFTGHVDEIHTPPYLIENSDLYYLPANTETAELNETTWEWEKTEYQTTFTEAQDFIHTNGFAVVMIHPYEFAKMEFGEYTGETDFEQIENLKKIIDQFKENGIEIVTIGEISEKTIYKSDENTVVEEIESCDCVYFRFVALQDYWLNNIQIEVIETFVEKELSLTVGVIGNVIGDDIKFINYLKNTINRNENIAIANNGWKYESLSEFSKGEQSLFLEQSNTKLNKVFGEIPSILIPPYDIFNSDTILAMKENGIDNLSSSVINDPIPYDIDTEIRHYPGSAFTGIYNAEEKLTQGVNHQETFTQIQNSLTNNGFAVVTLSPPEFAKVEDQNYLNEINDIQINELELLLERIQNEGLEIRPMVERTITHTEKPITVPVDENVSNCNGILIQSSNLNGCDFRHLTVQQVDLSHSNLIEANFAGLEIVNVNFANSIMSKSNLTNISMSGGSFENAKLDKIDLSNSNLQEVNLRGADLSEGNLKNFEYVNSDAKEASFVGADLSGAIFKGVGLAKTDFSNANLFESDLSGINLANAILKDVNFENAKLTGTSFLKAKLTGSILKGADLTNANLKDADLTNADLTGATLDNITLVNAILVGAQLPGADLQKAVLKETKWSGANLKDVNLSGADLSGATLNGADLTNVNFEGTNFSGADLSNTGLELKDLKNAITDDKTITSETGFFFFRELIAFFESLFK